MIISMQGNWTVRVKSKNAAFAQRFVIIGSQTNAGPYPGTVGTTVDVKGSQWSIAIQNDPGTGFQLSDAQIKFPQKVGASYEFEIWSNDAGGDKDFDDLILTCSAPATPNTFIVYGNVSLYSGRCIFNPCRRSPYIIDTWPGLRDALKNDELRKLIEKLYPDRVPPHGPIPGPDPGPESLFTPIVLDPLREATRPQTAAMFRRLPAAAPAAAAAAAPAPSFELARTVARSAAPALLPDLEAARVINGAFFNCSSGPAPGVTLSFEEYDRTAAEKAGGAYTGTGPRRLLGDTITDMNGNYIFRYFFGMSTFLPEDMFDVAPGDDMSVVYYPDLIAKVIGFSPNKVQYESAPYYNTPNLKRIDLCLPRTAVTEGATCFNGNLIDSLGNVFLGGNQNSTAATTAAALTRAGNGNTLNPTGTVSVTHPHAVFKVDCAAWNGVVDMKGCMYDVSKSAADNQIKWYTVRVRRGATGAWTFVTQNYKYPQFSKRNLPGYLGDDVGPAPRKLENDLGVLVDGVPSYINIQREVVVDHVDWEAGNLTTFLQLDTGLYDKVAGVTNPGTFHVRVDGYDSTGKRVATDMIALYIHNLPLGFSLSTPKFVSGAVQQADCNLFRLTDPQMNEPIRFQFQANDAPGFVDSYALTMSRCPSPNLALRVNLPLPAHTTTSSDTVLASGNAATTSPADTQAGGCPGYTGTSHDYSNTNPITVELQPALAEGGWIRTGEYFTILSFGLVAYKKVTNGYNTGTQVHGPIGAAIYMERL